MASSRHLGDSRTPVASMPPNDTPLVSVCMASFNHAPFIETAIASVLSQTYANWELVITDDGSTDDTPARLGHYRDPRIQCELFSVNRGACTTLNHSIRRARGEYIAILNSDDAWAPDKLREQLQFLLQEPGKAAVFTHVEAIDERGHPLREDHFCSTVFSQGNRSREEWLKRFLFGNNCLCHPSAMVRAAAYRRTGLYDERMTQLPDLDMWVRICCEADIWVLPARLTKFRVLDRERNASGNRVETRVRDEWETMLVWWKALQSHPLEIAKLLPSFPPDWSDKAIDPLWFSDNVLAGMRRGARTAILLWLFERMGPDADSLHYRRYGELVAEADPLGVETGTRGRRTTQSLRRWLRQRWPTRRR